MSPPSPGSVRDGLVTDIPTWTIDGCTFRGDGAFDADGRQWIIETEKGWASPAPRRTNRESRPDGDGASRSRSFADPRKLEYTGYVGCPNPADRELVEAQLAAMASDGGQLYQLRRTTSMFDQVVNVEVDDDPLIEMASLWTVKFSYQFAAPDPRKHNFTWQTQRATTPVPAAGGLDFSAPGLDFGTPGQPVAARVVNRGTADAHPVLTLIGPAPNPTIQALVGGYSLTYNGVIEAGEQVVINCDVFDALGAPGRSVTSSRRGYARNLLSVGVDWPVVPPGAAEEFALQVSGSTTAELVVNLRSARR